MSTRPEAALDIDAPLELVWSVMLDVERYQEWNPFVVRVDCPTPPSVGDRIVLHVRWANGKGTRSPEQISVLEGPASQDDGTLTATLAYDYRGLPSRLGLVRGRRWQRLVQPLGGPTSYHTVEEFSGPLVGLAGPGRVAEGFARHADGLRARAEELARTG